jgi:predicted porin
MKKSTLAMAVAAALAGFGTVAHADTTLYGSARVSVDYDENNSNFVRLPNGDLVRTSAGYDAWDVFPNNSRLGVRGEEDLGGGLSAIYQYEFGVDVTDGGNFVSNRPKWVGLKGTGWGSVTIGTQTTPYYNVTGISDIFNNTKSFDVDNFLGDRFGNRMDNSLIYTTPNWSGFSAQAMLVMNGSCATSDPQTPSELCTIGDNRLPANLSDGVDLWSIAATYKNGPFFAGGVYMALDGPGFSDFYTTPTYDGDQWALAFGYNAGPFAVSLMYENGDVNLLNIGKTENVYLTGQYTFGNNIIRGAYGYSSPDDGQLDAVADGVPFRITQSDRNNYALGYQYNFSKRTRAWVEWMLTDVDSELVGDRQTVSIGTRHDF